MSWYHLTWDADSEKHPNVPKEMAILLCNSPFNVRKIGRPIESTIVFQMTGYEKDVKDLYNAICGRFNSSFNCILSRVANVPHQDKSSHVYIVGEGMPKEHETPFGTILDELKGKGEIDKNVENVNVDWALS